MYVYECVYMYTCIHTCQLDSGAPMFDSQDVV